MPTRNKRRKIGASPDQAASRDVYEISADDDPIARLPDPSVPAVPSSSQAPSVPSSSQAPSVPSSQPSSATTSMAKPSLLGEALSVLASTSPPSPAPLLRARGFGQEVDGRVSSSPASCRTCGTPCPLNAQVHGWPEYLRPRLLDLLHQTRDIAKESENAMLSAWSQNVQLATFAVDWEGVRQPECEADVDIHLMSSQAFFRRQSNGEVFDKAVVIPEVFADSGDYSLQGYRERLLGALGDRPVQVQDGGRIQEIAIPELFTQLAQGKALNALSLSDHVRAIEPGLVRCHRYRLLDDVLTQIVANRQGSTAKQVRYHDIQSCLKFNILGGRGAFSGAHVDALDGTWLRTLFGRKLWWIVPASSMSSKDWEALAKNGDSWDPGTKARAIPLGPDDVLYLPPGFCVVHAVLTIEPSLMQGGVIWDEETLPSILANLYWIGVHQEASNEPLPYQMKEVVDRLEILSNRTGHPLNSKKQAIANGIRGMRSLGCKCFPCSKSSNCLCRHQGRRCTPFCFNHLPKRSNEWICMKECRDPTTFGTSARSGQGTGLRETGANPSLPSGPRP